MELPAIPLHVTFAPTVVAHHIRLASTLRGASSLCSAQHHRRRPLVAGVAILANTLGYPAPLVPRLPHMPPTIHTEATPKVPLLPPLALIHTLSQQN